jgi:hypothetical protein
VEMEKPLFFLQHGVTSHKVVTVPLAEK